MKLEKHNYVYIATAIVTITFLVVTFVFQYEALESSKNLNYNSNDKSPVTLNVFNRNLDRRPITAITSTTGTCADGWDAVAFGNFDGAAAGCKCTKRNNTGECIESQSPCQTSVPVVTAIELKKWRGRTICVRRSSSYAPADKENCAANQKKCNKFNCVAQTDDCPLTDATITRQVDGSLAFRTSTTSDSTPIVDIVYSINGVPCANPDTYPRRASGNVMQPLNRLEQGCDDFGDLGNMTTRMDAQSEADFYTDNGVNVNLIPGWTTFMQGENAVLYGIVRQLVDSATTCQRLELNRKDRLSEHIGLLKLDVDTHFDWNLYPLIIAAVAIVLAAVLFGFENQDGKPPPKFGISTLFLVVFHVCVIIIVINYTIELIHVADYYYKIDSILDYYTWLSKSNCFVIPGFITAIQRIADYKNNKDYIDLKDYIDYIGIAILIYNIISIILFIVMCIVLYQEKKEKEQKAKQAQATAAATPQGGYYQPAYQDSYYDQSGYNYPSTTQGYQKNPNLVVGK